MMHREHFSLIFFLAFFLWGGAGFLYAERISEVKADGTLVLDENRPVGLAGISLDEDGVRVLRVLASRHEVRVEKAKDSSEDAIPQVYLYTKAQVIPFPFKDAEDPREEAVMLNKLLVEMGAARVNEEEKFAYKKKFLAAQKKAKAEGKGIWSYESLS